VTAVTTARDPARRVRADSARGPFLAAVEAEWTKIRTVRSTLWTVFGGVLATVGATAALAGSTISGESALAPATRTRFDPAAYGLVGLQLGMIAFAVFGVRAMTAEYVHGTIRLSLAATPRRRNLFAAKVTVLAGIALAAGELAAVGSFVIGQLIYSRADLAASLTDPRMVGAVVGSGVYLALIALFGLGIGTITRHTASSMSTMVVVLYVLPVVGTTFPGAHGQAINKLLPATAGGAIVNTMASSTTLPPWTGLAVFAGYTALVLGAALLLFNRRDA
jgi:ABC-2 type transport system permease protein